MMKSLLKAVVCSCVIAGTAAPAFAAEPFEAEIGARKALMQVVKFNMGPLGAMAKGKRDYDPALAEALAKNIYSTSVMDTSLMWPEGSDNSVEALSEETKAKPGIWTNNADLQDKQKAWVDASEQMAASAGKGLDSLRKAMGPLGKSCKGCHKEYKAK
ncbi:MAG: c-type cytochrome [Pontibacterium sp.]